MMSTPGDGAKKGQRLRQALREALRRLGSQAEAEQVEALATLIEQAMGEPHRRYHTLDHVLGFVEEHQPFQTLAGLFHDLVYYSVDARLPPALVPLLAPYLRQEQGRFSIAVDAPPHRFFELALEVFGLARGVPLSEEEGMNEFLSALAMNVCLARLLSERHLVVLDVCIEATIPFRSGAPHGRDRFTILEERLWNANRRWGLGLSEAEVQESMRSAVRVANRDVAGFSDQPVGEFLATSWRLLVESHVALQQPFSGTVRQYRYALQDMESFFASLQAEQVFHRYADDPPLEEHERRLAGARRNIAAGREYFRRRLLLQALFEALALESGGDLPLATFLGDESQGGREVEILAPVGAATVDREALPWEDVNPTTDPDFPPLERRLLPLLRYLRGALTPEAYERAWQAAQAMFAGSLSPQGFLQAVDAAVVGALVQTCAALCPQRREELVRIEVDFG